MTQLDTSRVLAAQDQDTDSQLCKLRQSYEIAGAAVTGASGEEALSRRGTPKPLLRVRRRLLGLLLAAALILGS